MRLTLDKQSQYARELVARMRDQNRIRPGRRAVECQHERRSGINAQRKRVIELKQKLAGLGNGATAMARDLDQPGGYAGQEERVDHGRRRLGLRHRSRSRHVLAQRHERQRAGA